MISQMNKKHSFKVLLLIALTLFLTACTNSLDVSNIAPSEEYTIDPIEVPAVDVEENIPSTTPFDFLEIDPESTKPYVGSLELPVVGATGYTSVALELKESANLLSPTIDTVKAGSAFEIMKEEADWWYVRIGKVYGWLQNKYCFINLPDVIPSIIYDNTNTYSSKFVSSGKEIPNVTHQELYSGKVYNQRLGKDEYIIPVLYSMSKKIYVAQQQALTDGNSLKIYEGYRPYSIQKTVVKNLSELAKYDLDVMTGISSPPWHISWFIYDGLSNHQFGYAIDVSLVKVNSKKEISIGNYRCIEITDYTEYEMPTQIHELSMASAIFTTAITSDSATAWLDATLADTVNEAAQKLQLYCTKAGLTPLASEWWHFNDLDAKKLTAEKRSNGSFTLTEIHSSVPLVTAKD